MKLTVPPVGVVVLGGLVVTVAVRISFWPYVSDDAETAKLVVVALESAIRSSSAVTIGSIRRRTFRTSPQLRLN
jgi:hypothetical protein